MRDGPAQRPEASCFETASFDDWAESIRAVCGLLDAEPVSRSFRADGRFRGATDVRRVGMVDMVCHRAEVNRVERRDRHISDHDSQF
ncbi:MAG: hypothetical protein WEB93_04905, partial [Sphingomonadales bacterium]